MSEETPKFKEPKIFGMLTSPKLQFRRINNTEVILNPLVIVSLITLLSLLFPIIRNRPEDMGNTLFERIIYYFGMLIESIPLTVILILIPVLIFTGIHLLVAKLFKSPVTFRRLFSMNAHLAIFTAIGSLVNEVLAFIFKNATVESFTSLQTIFKHDGMLGAGLATFELFFIWQLVVMALGLRKVAGYSKTASWTFVLIFFGIILTMDMSSYGL